MMTFIPKGLTTRCKKSTKQEIELGEFPCSGFVWRRCKKKGKAQFQNVLFSHMYWHLVFLIVTF